MRVIVVGSVPPPSGGHRGALLAEVLRLRSQGHEVEIVSLDPLAASHSYLAAPGVPAAIEAGLLARRADVLIVQLEPGLPVRNGAGRAERAAALMAMARALRGADVTLRLHHPDDLPGGPGGRAGIELWAAARRIEVGSESLRDELAGILGPLAERLVVAVGPDDGPDRLDGASLESWGDGADATAAQVMSLVRLRAAAEREHLWHRGMLDEPGRERPARVAQWQWLPAPGAGVPDLGRLRRGSQGHPGRGRLRRPSSGSRRPAPVALSVRRGASRLLAAAERRPATRSVAHLARLTWIEIRRPNRRGV